jgi:hypothetical protein
MEVDIGNILSKINTLWDVVLSHVQTYVLTSEVITAIITIGGVWLTNSITNRHTGKVKIWELRRVAYEAILSELSAVDNLCKTARSYIDEDYERYFYNGVRDNHNKK